MNLLSAAYRSLSLAPLLFAPFFLAAQGVELEGRVLLPNGEAAVGAEVTLAHTPHWDRTDSTGAFRMKGVETGDYLLQVFVLGYSPQRERIELDSSIRGMELTVDTSSLEMREVEVQGEGEQEKRGHLRSIEGMGIYAGKKSELVHPEESGADRSSDKSRELFSEVAGVVAFEDGDGGSQMEIGSRGLSPKRSAHFNMRQNGSDMSADALGYPEAYYTPPSQAVERIEVVRGAASLQYGPQFGGMVNFELKGAPKSEGVRARSNTTLGSFGFFNSYVELGGRKKNTAFQSFYEHRRGDGWRPNSEHWQETGHFRFEQRFSKKTRMTLEYTRMSRLRQQPGGLTEEAFLDDPSVSLRERNWFQVKWNLGALKLSHRFSSKARIETRFFGTLGERNAVGILSRIDRADHGGERLLLKDRYRNFGNETRYLQHYRIGKRRSSLLIGTRYYQGRTHRRQGPGSEGKGPDFSYLSEGGLDSDFHFPSRNLAFFAENVFRMGDRWTLTPGVRVERIRTASEGWYQQENRDLAGNLLHEATIDEERESERAFLLYGLGLGYRLKNGAELFGNFSTNYRGIGFNDMRLVNPNFRVDPELKDESGYTADLGIRGRFFEHLEMNLSLFTLYYSDRIGAVLQVDSNNYDTYRYRTNIADSRNIGVESYFELRAAELFDEDTRLELRPFLNLTYQKARYINSEEAAFEGKRVEMAPRWSSITGLKGAYGDFEWRYQLQYISHQYADATNARSIPSAEVGLIPDYQVSDLSIAYTRAPVKLRFGVHNLFDQRYFTHRAKGYSGPGIVPAPPRNYYITLSLSLGADK